MMEGENTMHVRSAAAKQEHRYILRIQETGITVHWTAQA